MPSYSSFFVPLFLLLWLQASRITAQAGPGPKETITISSEVFLVNPTHVVLNGKTVSPGGSAIRVDGEIVSADRQNDLFVNGVEVITASVDSDLGIPVVPTSCTASACIVSIENIKPSSSNTAQTKAHTHTKQSESSSSHTTLHSTNTRSKRSPSETGTLTSNSDTTLTSKTGKNSHKTTQSSAAGNGGRITSKMVIRKRRLQSLAKLSRLVVPQ